MERLKKTVSFFTTGAISAYLDIVAIQSGSTKERLRIDHPKAAAVIPFLDEGSILMVRQYRYAAGIMSLEVPAGKVEEGEDPLQCAGRELMEETGYRASRLEEVVRFHPAAAYSSELLYVFTAFGLHEDSSLGRSEEIAEVVGLTFGEAVDLVFRGEITDAKTIIGLLWLHSKRP